MLLEDTISRLHAAWTTLTLCLQVPLHVYRPHDPRAPQMAMAGLLLTRVLIPLKVDRIRVHPSVVANYKFKNVITHHNVIAKSNPPRRKFRKCQLLASDTTGW